MKKVSLAPGDACRFVHRDQPVGVGYFNAHSLIAGRVLAHGSTESINEIVDRHIEEAFRRRSSLIQRGSCRLVFSEGDFLPGLIVDTYSGTLVVQSNTAGIDRLMPHLKLRLPALFEEVFHQRIQAFLIRSDSSIRTLEGIPPVVEVILGDPASLSAASFEEAGVRYAANFISGQKTGFFLDQYDNRRYARSLGAGRVLDLCCYSGGWGLAALAGGSEYVTFVDQSEDALQLARKGMTMNNFHDHSASFVRADVFEFLEKDDALYDLVIADPPAFVKSKKNLPQAIKGYEKLNRLAWRRVKPGGTLMTSSCSYHLSAADFVEMLRRAISRERGVAHVVYTGQQGTDHPILLSMPETNYLKCLGLGKIK